MIIALFLIFGYLLLTSAYLAVLFYKVCRLRTNNPKEMFTALKQFDECNCICKFALSRCLTLFFYYTNMAVQFAMILIFVFLNGNFEFSNYIEWLAFSAHVVMGLFTLGLAHYMFDWKYAKPIYSLISDKHLGINFVFFLHMCCFLRCAVTVCCV